MARTTQLAAVVAALALILLAAAGPAYRIGLLSIPSAFTLLAWAAYVGIAAMVLALIAGAWAYRRRARSTMLLAGFAFIAGLAAFAIPFQWQTTAQSLPRIHDVTTDL